MPWWTSARLALAFVGFLGFVNLYALRVNLSVAMVCMINQTAVALDSNSSDLPDLGTDLLHSNSSGTELHCPNLAGNKTLKVAG